MTRDLSTTGYAVLGLLALRPLTPYEIVQQKQRSLDYCWPSSERSLYDQPEKLAAQGYAEVVLDEQEPARRRYAITEAGRDALHAWLATDSAMPKFQNEPLLRVLYADQGTPEDLRRVLTALRVHVAERRQRGIDQIAPYVEGEGLFQERAHIVAITGDLITRMLDTLDDWAADVLELSSDWPTTADVGLTEDIRRLLAHMVANESARAAASTPDG